MEWALLYLLTFYMQVLRPEGGVPLVAIAVIDAPHPERAVVDIVRQRPLQQMLDLYVPDRAALHHQADERPRDSGAFRHGHLYCDADRV